MQYTEIVSKRIEIIQKMMTKADYSNGVPVSKTTVLNFILKQAGLWDEDTIKKVMKAKLKPFRARS